MKELTINEMELVSGAMAVLPKVGQAVAAAAKNPSVHHAASGAAAHGTKTEMAGEEHALIDYIAAGAGGAAGGGATKALGGSSSTATSVGTITGGAAEGFVSRVMDLLGVDSDSSKTDGNDYCEDGGDYQ